MTDKEIDYSNIPPLTDDQLAAMKPFRVALASLEVVMQRYEDWFRQAKRKLDSARWDIEGEFYEDACFSAQQAAELAAKALLQRHRKIVLGHSVYQLFQKLEHIPPRVFDAARVLDRYYIQTRYPNGFPAGAPMDYYDRRTAEEAVNLAATILEFVGSQL